MFQGLAERDPSLSEDTMSSAALPLIPKSSDISSTHLAVPVQGMTCAACSTRLERALSKRAGILTASVSLAAERADVEFDPAAIAPGEISNAI
jgi:Cu+-exporting ATPase